MGLTGFQVKVVAIVAMTIDHLGAVFFPEYLWMRVIGRISMPVFCYFVAEGFMYTSNKGKYASRLLLFAFLSEIPYQMCFWERYGAAGNVFWTLLLGMLSLWLFDFIYRKTGQMGMFLGILSLLPLCFLSMHMPVINIYSILFSTGNPVLMLTATDYACKGVMAIFFIGMFHAKGVFFQSQSAVLPKSLHVSAGSCEIIGKWIMQIFLTGLVIWERSGYVHWGWDMQTAFLLGPLLGSVLLTAYGGERGANGILAKYLFYFYYPLHLLLFGII